MKTILFAAFMALAGCAVQPTIDLAQVHNDVYVTCHSNLERKDVNYLKSNRHDYPSDIFPAVTLSNIIDVYGKPWTINSQEWTQFTCTEKPLP